MSGCIFETRSAGLVWDRPQQRKSFIVKSSYAPLKPYSYIPSPAFSVVEGLAVGEGGALGVSDENTLDSGYGLRE